MTAFELLAYVVAFVLSLSFGLTIIIGIYTYTQQKKSFEDFLKRKSKMEGTLNGNKSNKEK